MTYQMQVTIPYDTGLPTDVCTNTWHFVWPGGGTPDAGDFAALAGDVEVFYEGVYNSNSDGAFTMGSYATPALTEFKIYDLTDPKPRVPVYEAIRPLTVVKDATNTNVPAESACVLSYHTQFESGVAKASQRGRVFLGVLGNSAIQPATTSLVPRISLVACTKIGLHAKLLASNTISHDWGWVVHSQKLNADYAVAAGWVDNAIDTQRRRGQVATSRTVWTD